jgi:hypothetical protein
VVRDDVETLYVASHYCYICVLALGYVHPPHTAIDTVVRDDADKLVQVRARVMRSCVVYS